MAASSTVILRPTGSPPADRHSLRTSSLVGAYERVRAEAVLQCLARAVQPDKGAVGLGDFLRDYTAGVTARDLRGLFGRDAAHAFRVLTRDRPDEPEPRGNIARFWHRTRLLFLGISFKLAPARRALFGISVVATVLSLFDLRFTSASGNVHVQLNAFWALLAVGILMLLLALELVDRVLVRDELEVARQLQRDLLPGSAPTLPGYTFAHSYRTANEIGGDYYDFLTLPDGRFVMVIGDASGHGMAAGLLMAIAAAVLRLATDLDPSPRRVAELLNQALCRTGDRHAFMTLFYAILEPDSGRLDYVCAGHPFPLLRHRNGEIEELGQGGLPLGIKPSVAVSSGSVQVEPGELLALYTDGLPETVNQAGQAFGYDRLAQRVREESAPQRLHDRMLANLDAHRAHAPLLDDLSLVIIRREPAPVAAA
jgi:phosphoserine phosphatase RsbU/P